MPKPCVPSKGPGQDFVFSLKLFRVPDVEQAACAALGPVRAGDQVRLEVANTEARA